MQTKTIDTSKNNNTTFALRMKHSQNIKPTMHFNFANFQTPGLFEDDRDYSCIPNIQNTTVYLSETTYSGKLLNTHSKLRDETSSKFLFASSSEKHEFDRVYTDKQK